jgi:hypothetical protein
VDPDDDEDDLPEVDPRAVVRARKEAARALGPVDPDDDDDEPVPAARGRKSAPARPDEDDDEDDPAVGVDRVRSARARVDRAVPARNLPDPDDDDDDDPVVPGGGRPRGPAGRPRADLPFEEPPAPRRAPTWDETKLQALSRAGIGRARPRPEDD